MIKPWWLTKLLHIVFFPYQCVVFSPLRLAICSEKNTCRILASSGGSKKGKVEANDCCVFVFSTFRLNIKTLWYNKEKAKPKWYRVFTLHLSCGTLIFPFFLPFRQTPPSPRGRSEKSTKCYFASFRVLRLNMQNTTLHKSDLRIVAEALY